MPCRTVCRHPRGNVPAHSQSHTALTLFLQDANRYTQHFSSEKIPTLHRVIPALEALCTRWEKKLKKPKYALYHPAIKTGLAKLNKYYTKLDHTHVYILALREYALIQSLCMLANVVYMTVLHPYYKLIHRQEMGRCEGARGQDCRWQPRRRQLAGVCAVSDGGDSECASLTQLPRQY